MPLARCSPNMILCVAVNVFCEYSCAYDTVCENLDSRKFVLYHVLAEPSGLASAFCLILFI